MALSQGYLNQKLYELWALTDEMHSATSSNEHGRLETLLLSPRIALDPEKDLASCSALFHMRFGYGKLMYVQLDNALGKLCMPDADFCRLDKEVSVEEWTFVFPVKIKLADPTDKSEETDKVRRESGNKIMGDLAQYDISRFCIDIDCKPAICLLPG